MGFDCQRCGDRGEWERPCPRCGRVYQPIQDRRYLKPEEDAVRLAHVIGAARGGPAYDQAGRKYRTAAGEWWLPMARERILRPDDPLGSWDEAGDPVAANEEQPKPRAPRPRKTRPAKAKAPRPAAPAKPRKPRAKRSTAAA